MSIAASLSLCLKANFVPRSLVVEKADNRSGYEQELEAFFFFKVTCGVASPTSGYLNNALLELQQIGPVTFKVERLFRWIWICV